MRRRSCSARREAVHLEAGRSPASPPPLRMQSTPVSACGSRCRSLVRPCDRGCGNRQRIAKASATARLRFRLANRSPGRKRPPSWTPGPWEPAVDALAYPLPGLGGVNGSRTPADPPDDGGNIANEQSDEVRRRNRARQTGLGPVDVAGDGPPRSSKPDRRFPRAPRKSAPRRRVASAAGHAGPPPPSVRVDSARAALLPYAPPVADWLLFLAERLAAEYLREMTRQDTAP
jgi:hypothetical protein